MGLKFSKYFYDSQKAHEQHAFNAMKKDDHLLFMYHNKIIEEQKRKERVLARVEKQIIYLEIHKGKIMKEVEKYDASKSWLKG